MNTTYQKDPTELLTCDEALERLRCGYSTLYRLLKDGSLHAFKEGVYGKYLPEAQMPTFSHVAN